MSLLADACGDVAVCLTANPKATAGELRVVVGWFREARDQTSRHRGEADSYAIDLACYLAAVEGNPDPLRNIAGAYLALDVCPFEAPAYEYLERWYFGQIAALLLRPGGELLEPTKRHARMVAAVQRRGGRSPQGATRASEQGGIRVRQRGTRCHPRDQRNPYRLG